MGLFCVLRDLPAMKSSLTGLLDTAHRRVLQCCTLHCCTLRSLIKVRYTACISQDELAKSVTTEQGKTFQDAKGDVFRGLGAQQRQQQQQQMQQSLGSSCYCTTED
jgi:hypothetical protein